MSILDDDAARALGDDADQLSSDPRPDASSPVLSRPPAILFARLGEDPAAAWLLTTDAPIDRHALPPRVHVLASGLPPFRMPLDDITAAWHGYRFMLIGVCDAEARAGRRYLFVTTPAGEIPVRLLYGHLQYDGDPLAVEHEWPLDATPPPRVLGAQPRLSAEQWARFGRGYDLLAGLGRALGRADDTGEFRTHERERFLAYIRPAVVELVTHEQAVNDTSLAGTLGKGRKWVRKYRNMFTLNFTQLADEIRREIGG
jgi:hypothetical protein